MTEASRSDRVAYAESVSSIYDSLREEGSNVEASPFKTFKDVFMFAAFLGFNKRVRQKLPPGNRKTIRLEVFTREDRDLIQAIAIADSGSIDILRNFSEIVVIVEEYANAGIYDLQAELLKKDGKALWNLVELVGSNSALKDEKGV